MHLSRFITIATCALTRIRTSPPAARPRRSGAASVLHLLGAAADDGDLVPLVAGGAVVVERERELPVAADHVRGLDDQPGQRVVRPTVPPGNLRLGGHQVGPWRDTCTPCL